MSIHGILAASTKTPEFALDEKEAKALATAAADVAKYYPTTIDPKTIAWCNLATCIGLTYGPRVYLVRMRHEAERRERAERSSTSTVTAFPGAGFGGVPN